VADVKIRAASQPVPIVLDLTQTAHCPASTGVQRMCRHALAAFTETGAEPTALIADSYARRWRPPVMSECALLATSASEHPATHRSEIWTPGQILCGYLRWVPKTNWTALRGAPLLAMEIFSPRVFAAYATLRENLASTSAAIFYDTVALRFPELAPPEAVERTHAYLRELTSFDGVAAISESSRADLLKYWCDSGLQNTPPVTVISPGFEKPVDPPQPPPTPGPDGPLILSVGTIEGRKNHLALLDAAETLWNEGRRFRLVLAGLHRPQTASAALGRAKELCAKGRPLEIPGPLPDSRIEELYAACHFTVYPSLYEGFGMPVIESLLRHRPCICGTGGALAQAASEGGCVAIMQPDVLNLAQAIRSLLDDPVLHTRLITEAAGRRAPTWQNFAGEILTWIGTLHRKNQS